MNDFRFVAQEYSIQNTKNYRLSIQVNPDGFSVLTADTERKILAIIHRQTGSVINTREAFKREEALIKLRELTFLSCHLLINSSRVSLYPADLSNEISSLNLMNLEFDDADGSSVITRSGNLENIYYKFSVEKEFANLVAGFRNNPKIDHLTGEFLSYILSGKSFSENSCFLYSTPGLLHMAITENSALMFYNVFQGNNNEELLYHLFNTLRITDNSSDTEIYYSGHLLRSDKEWKILTEHLGKIQLLPNELGFELAGNINENYFNYLLESSGENYQW